MAGPFPQEFIETVRESGDIVRLISDYVPLKQAGSRYKGLCPFHQEKTPSFSVDANNQLFYCFGCQTGGDIFKFVMLYENLGFGEAVEQLAERWGVPLPERARQATDGPQERLRGLTEAALAYFRAQLADAGAGRPCREYLAGRGIDDATVERLALGYAPEGWSGLLDHLATRHFRPEEMLQAGLVLERKSGRGIYDRFRDRLVFPIRDARGRTIAFGGRTLGSDEPKYINSPETPLYKKGDHLYGFDRARDGIRREGCAVVVEGYLDVAALVQHGFDHVVASLGTAFTPAQARLLARSTQRVVFSYDGDAAGAKATERSLGLLLEQGFEVRVVDLPAGTDPDDFIRAEGAAAYGERLRGAPPYLEFLIRREARDRDMARIEDKVAAINAVLPHVARLTNAVERASWAGRIADALRIDEEWITQELRGAVRGARPEIRKAAPAVRREPREAEWRLVTRLLNVEAERARWAGEIDLDKLSDSAVAPIVRVICERSLADQTVDYPTVFEALGDEADRELLTRIAFRDEPDDGPTVEDCLWAFDKKRLARDGRQVLREIGQLQRSSEGTGTDEVDRRLMQLQELVRQRDALS